MKYSWHRHYQGIWQALQGYPWSTQLQPVIEALSMKQREHLMSLISTAYATVTPSKVAMLCGLTEREALSGEMTRCGTRGVLKPVMVHVPVVMTKEPKD